MKTQSIIILSALLSLLLSACGGEYNYPPVLDEISRVADDDPERAMAMLDSVRPTLDHDDESVMMYHSLLTIKAHDKAYITHTSDSAIVAIINHYENGGDPRHLPLAYYYGGRVYSDLGDAPQALDYFLKANEVVTNTTLKSLICSQMGQLYLNMGIYDEAHKYTKASLDYDNLLKDSIGIIYNIVELGNIEFRQAKYDSALCLYEKALSQSERLNNKIISSHIHRQLSGLYLFMNKLDNAKTHLNSCLNLSIRKDIPNVYSMLSFYHLKKENYDSVKYYSEQVLPIANIHIQMSTYARLSKVALAENKITEARDYLNKYITLRDSAEQLNDSETLRRMTSLYNYQLREKKNHELEAENNQKDKFIEYLSFSIIIICLILVSIIQYLKRRKARIELKFRLFKEQQDIQYRKSQSYISENNKKIAKLQQDLDEIVSENSILRSQLIEQKEMLEYANKQAHKDITFLMSQLDALQKSEICYAFKAKPNITTEDWHELESEIIKNFPQFKITLYSLAPKLTLKEYRICMLVKSGIRPIRISELLYTSIENVSTIRRRLYKKISGNNGSTYEADDFILQL